MKYIISSLIVCLVILFACNSSKQTKLFSTDNLETKEFTINTDRDTVLETAGGALINIPKGSLSVAGSYSVTLNVKEAYTMADIINAGLTTTSNGQPLSSGGMIYINVKEKDVKINKPLQVAMPSNNLNDSMKLYKGEIKEDGKINWVEPKDLPENKQIAAVNRGELLYQQNCTSCHAIDTKVIGPPLAHFLKRFPLPEKPDENYWGYQAHPPFGIIAYDKKADSTAKPVAAISESAIRIEGGVSVDISVHEEKPDTAKSNKDDNEILKLMYKECNMSWYAHTMEAYSPTNGQAFKFSLDDLNKIYKYIQNESDRLGLPDPGEMFPDDCIDSCIIYTKRLSFLQKVKTVTDEKREKFIEENGEMTVVIPDPTWGQTNTAPPDLNKRVSPNNYDATFYQFTVESFGWYNIDALISPQFKGVKESELYARVIGGWKDRVNIFLIIPSEKIYGEGGPADINPEEYAFFYRDGKLPLTQNVKAYILAVSEKDDKIAYGLTEFRTTLKQKIDVQLKESSKAEFDNAIASLGANDLSFTVNKSINADSIRAADKKLKDIDQGLKDAEQLKPKNCNCNCGEEGDSFTYPKSVTINKK